MKRIILYNLISFVALGLFLSCNKENETFNQIDNKGVDLIDYISNHKACIINTDVFPTEDTWFEIKIDLGPNPEFWMGCWDCTDNQNRIVSRFFIYDKDLCYDFPDDWGESRRGRTICTLDLSKTNLHTIRFGNKYVHDLTTGYKKDNTAVADFSIKAPFGLFGMMEYKGEGQPLVYNVNTWSEVNIYYFRAYQNDKLIADMAPAKDAEGTICMYDKVRNRFFYRLDKDGNKIQDGVSNDGTDEEKLIKLTSKDYVDGAYFDGILYYKVISNINSNVEISKAQQSVEEVSVPTKIIINEKEYTVTSIGINAFQNCSNLKTIVIPEKVTSIGESAFSGCSGLPTVIIPDNVTAISNNTFKGCTGLSSITIPSRITSIGDYAFSGCTGLTSICIPESVVSIGGNAFDGCSGLKKVIVPNISAWCRIAFSSQTSNPLYYAHHLYINDGSTELKDLIIPNNITSISQNAFYGCSGLTSVVIPDNVTSIGNHAFSRCDGIASLSIPSSVKSIGDYAFESCIGLSSLYVFCSPTKIGDNIFYNCEKLKEAVFDCKIVTPILKGNHYLKKVSIAEGVTSIGDYAFYNCINLETLKVTNSKDSKKSYYTELRSIPESVTSIGDYAFYCAGLRYFASSNGLESIGAHAFEFTNQKCIIVGKNVKSLREYAFYKYGEYSPIIYCCGPAPQATYNTLPKNNYHYSENKYEQFYTRIVKDFAESYKSTFPWNQIKYWYMYGDEAQIWIEVYDICKRYLDDHLDNR